jgi:hypothetical protein
MSWPPADIDPECLALCNALNRLPGIETFSSCCGHGRNPFTIFFTARRLTALPRVVYSAQHDTRDDCHHRDWQVIAWTDCGMAPISFVLQGPIGDYEGAAKMAAALDAVRGRPRRPRRRSPATQIKLNLA